MQTKNNTKILVETGLMFGIILVITIMTSYMPILSEIGMFILPIPITLLYIRHNFKVAISAVALSILMTSFVYNPLLAINSGVMYGLVGISLGYCIKNKKGSGYSITIVSLFGFLATIIRFMVYSIFVDKQGIKGYLNILVNELNESFKRTKEMYMSMNAPQEVINRLNELTGYITIKNLLITLPIVFLINSLVQSYINYVITRKVLKKLGYDMKNAVPFSRIYVPNRLAALLIISECLGIILNSKGLDKAIYISNIINSIVTIVISIDGMACLTYILRERFRISKIATALLIIISLSIPIFSNVYFLLGLTDIILNLRKLDPNPIWKSKLR